MRFDLHSHTTRSDGLLSPTELVCRAAEKGVDVLAITDHDTVAGLAEAQRAIEDKALALHLVPGVEISTSWLEFEIHIVGLQVDATCPKFLARLETQQQRRRERAEEMARRLEKNKIPDVLENVLRIADGAALTRTHFARYLVEIGKAPNLNGVFKKYLGRGKTGYVPNNWVSLQEAVQWILEAGGTPVLAHPLKYNLNGRYLTRLTEAFALAGGQAIEVASAQITPVQKRQVWDLAKKFALTASAGSDFHQPTPWNELGRQLYFTEDIIPVWHHWEIATSKLA